MLLERLASEGGRPALRFLDYCPGGTGGAARIVGPDDRPVILSSVRGDEENRVRHAHSLEVLERLWNLGHPVPRYLDVVDLGDVLAVVQEEAEGVPPDALNATLVERLLELEQERRHLLSNCSGGQLCLYLRENGPSFASHGTLADHSDRTRSLLRWIEEVGEQHEDRLEGTDAVHYDYHLGNVLVDPADPRRVTAIVDWDGACAGPGGFDLVTLAFVVGPSLSRDAAAERLLTHSLASQPEDVLLLSWAHLSLRLVDWAIRFNAREVGYWLDVAESWPERLDRAT